MKKEHWLYLVIAVLIIWVIASYVTAPNTGYAPENDIENSYTEDGVDTSMPTTKDETENTPAPGATDINGGTSSVGVVNQAAGNTVLLGAVTMSADGWVVVHEEREGKPGNILGAQRFDAGFYAAGMVELLRGTTAGGKYYVMIHADDGDRMFDHKKDMPLMVDGSIAMITFIAQ